MRLKLLLISLFLTTQIFADQMKLEFDLEITEPPKAFFNRLTDIATDSENNIYVLDSKEQMIFRFDENGKFLRRIGRQGQGPGEFIWPTSIYIDSRDIIYVLDISNQRIEVFDSESNYVKSIGLEHFSLSSWARIVVDEIGDLYVSGNFNLGNSVLAKYTSSGKLIKTFPLPVIEYKGPKFDQYQRMAVKRYLGGGEMCFDGDGRIYFSYSWPYLIKVFDQEGNELNQISRKNDHNWIPLILRTEESGIFFSEFTQTNKIFFLNETNLVNSIICIDWEGDPNFVIPVPPVKPWQYYKIKKRYAVLDFYSKEGNFVGSVEIDEKIHFLSSDNKGRVLGVKIGEDDIPSIVRYKAEIIKDK